MALQKKIEFLTVVAENATKTLESPTADLNMASTRCLQMEQTLEAYKATASTTIIKIKEELSKTLMFFNGYIQTPSSPPMHRPLAQTPQ